MTCLLAIDPGSAGRGCACAAWEWADVVGIGGTAPRDGTAPRFGRVTGRTLPRLVEVWFERALTFQAVAGATCQVRDLPPADPRARARWEKASGVDAIVVEKPAPQGGRTLAARYEDLANLSWDGALLAGAFAGRDGAPIFAWPATDWNGQRGWKGTECKPHNHKRLWAVLDDAERRILGGDATAAAIEAACEKWARKRGGIEGAKCYSSDVHNLLDAAALGACFLGRMKRA